jgi:Zn-dependent protease with chaperone function
MTASFLVMAAGVFFAGALAGALAGVLGTRVAGGWTEKLAPRAQIAFWMLIAVMPWVLGLAALVAALLPSFGFGADHCLVHGAHHPHLCLHHPQDLSFPALLLAGIGIARLAIASAREARKAWTARQAIALLRGANAQETQDDVRVVPGSLPAAFVAGTVRPQIYLSQAAAALPHRLLAPVLAHERCHVACRHLLWRLVARIAGALHVPAISRAIDNGLTSAQELEADASAARAVGDRLVVAESLLLLARARAGAPTGALAFGDGSVRARVMALTDVDHNDTPWPLAVVTALALLTVVAAVTSPTEVHHALETLLGWLH